MTVRESAARTGAIGTFAAVGCLSITQDLAGAVLQEVRTVEGHDPGVVAEETLALVSVTSSRALMAGLRDFPEVAEAVVPHVADLPFTYRDYVVGHAMLDGEPGEVMAAQDGVYERLARKRAFYDVHFPSGQFPGERALTEKMALWMGRVSPPGMPDSPDRRLARLGLVSVLHRHLKLLRARCASEG